MRKYKRPGWYGDSQGHSLAARGIRRYSASKSRLVDPVFLAAKREETVPTTHIMQMLLEKNDFDRIRQMHPDADIEDLRLRSIKIYDSMNGNNTLQTLNKQGVDASVRLAKADGSFKKQVKDVLDDRVGSSFLPDVKVELLKKNLF